MRRRLCERLRKARTTTGDGASVNDVYSVFKGLMNAVAAEMVGYRVDRGRRKKNAWWTDEIKEAVEEKRRAYEKMLKECG